MSLSSKISFNPQDQFWSILIGLGNTATLERVNMAYRRLNVPGKVREADLSQFEAAEAGQINSSGQIQWFPEVLHQATLQLHSDPTAPLSQGSIPSLVAAKIAAEAPPMGYYDRDLINVNLARWRLYSNVVFPVVFANDVSLGMLLNYFSFPVDTAWLSTRLVEIQSTILEPQILHCFQVGEFPSGSLELEGVKHGLPAVLLAIARADQSALTTALQKDTSLRNSGFRQVAQLLKGDLAEANRGFSTLLKPTRRSPLFVVAAFGLLAALRSGDFVTARTYASLAYAGEVGKVYAYFGEISQRLETSNWSGFKPLGPLASSAGFVMCAVKSFEGALPAEVRPDRRAQFQAAQKIAKKQGFKGFEAQFDDNSQDLSWSQGLEPKQSWEYFLEGLQTLGSDSSKAPKNSSSDRLLWRMNDDPNLMHMDPIRQKMGKKGWVGNTTISWQTLLTKPPDFLSEQDRVAIGKVEKFGTGARTNCSLTGAFWKAMLGHPNVERYGKPYSIVEMPPTLHCSRIDDRIRIEFKPKPFWSRDFFLAELAPEQLGVCFLNQRLLKLVELLHQPIEFPIEAKGRLRESLSPWLGDLDITYDGVEPLITTQAGDPQVRVQLEPYKAGLRLRLRVRPLGLDGPALVPGEGLTQESLRWKGIPVLISRDLEAEENSRQQLLAACPSLFRSNEQEFPEAEESLEMLLELQDSGYVLEWSDKPWTVTAVTKPQTLRLQASQNGDWFELQGTLSVNESNVLNLQRALEISRNSRGRFMELEPGKFVALSEQLKQRLSAVDELVESHRKELRFSALAVPTLAELDEELEVDSAFTQVLERFAKADTLQPHLPSDLQAELRDYQREGYQWMVKRSAAGVGVCLADDMGLGKTVQSIAVLLREQEAGIQLVICPTSVTSNWYEQIGKFAPSLRPHYWEGKSRSDKLESLTAGDIVLCSYRMLLQDHAILKAVDWRCIILDEAQFIKNPDSKTARAVFELNSAIRIATTGTPIENRLSELWSIFRFINPGLLGSLPSFQKRFEVPVLSGQAGPRQRLRRLVSPFILRRTKAQVLTELPPRTELTLTVELNSVERSLYEGVRREALEKASAENSHLQMLAMLTRLRQACCHPQLLLPHESLNSSKFEAFFNLADELLAGGHRALVFSQFVGLLKLLEAELQARKLSYLYLDGSTASSERRERVKSFQAGEGDFFLISLKAGGTGLNLTGADYVIHLDPWWNPAAEDQASDRAHRIGQTRPVTIYRLIAQDTVEEKVVKLHAVKRELAMGVLEGADGQSSLTSDDLLDLLKP